MSGWTWLGGRPLAGVPARDIAVGELPALACAVGCTPAALGAQLDAAPAYRAVAWLRPVGQPRPPKRT